ncbi:hypothetical protein CAL7716_058770 [Calothrix sp. PCC 7716]|nr:hypothetical protein CAL7716_058770 [Calothrix sp. PCC 7716]
MEVVLLLLNWVAGSIVSIVITLFMSETLKNWLAPFVSQLGSKQDEGVKGLWLATFYYGQQQTPYIEAIEVSELFGVVVGRIVPYPDNHPTAKKVEQKFPLRLRGSVQDSRYFTGIWFHPNRRSHVHGAFKMLISQDNEHMNGMWLGYSESKNVIESDKWIWQRLDV